MEVCMAKLCLSLTILLAGAVSIAAAQTSRSAIAYTNRAMTRYAHGDLDGAISDLGIAIEFDSSYAAAFYDRGRVWHERGNFDEAIADYSKAIALDPRFAPAY